MFECKINQPRKPARNLVIFLHGYNDCVENYVQTFELLERLIPNSCIAMPQSAEICEKNSSRRQWFEMQKHDPLNLRVKPETTLRQINMIYQKTAPDINACALQINAFIDELQKKCDVNNHNTWLIGFSQGAMLALYTALSRFEQIGGVFVVSGLVAGRKLLAKNLNSLPPVYLFHGQDDLKVQFKTLKSTLFWLKRHGLTTKVFTYPQQTHVVTNEEIIKICSVINQNQP